MAAVTLLSLRRQWCLSLAITCLFPILSAASPWIVTANYEEVVTVIPGYTNYADDYTEPAQTYSDIVTITSPSGTAISTSTITQTDYYSETYTIVEVLYPYNPAATSTSAAYATATTEGYGYAFTNYYVNLAYTAPKSCSTTWTYTTAVPVDPPYEIEDALVPTSFSTSYLNNLSPFQPTTTTKVYAYIDPTQVPASSLSILRYNYEPYPSCYNPSSDDSTSGDLSSSSSSSSGTYSCGYYYCSSDDGSVSWINDSSYYGISPLAIILITVLGWSFVIFVAGLFESYFYFQRLMKGWQARRGLPITWWFWIFPVTVLICLGFSRRGFQARNEEDARELRQNWEDMGFWKRKRLWLQYGFTWGYPSILGPAPPRVGRPSKAMPTQPLLQVSPPTSETGGISRQPTPQTSDGDDDVESAALTASTPHKSHPAMSGDLSSQTPQVPPPVPKMPQRAPNRSVEPIPEQDETTEAPATGVSGNGEELAEKPILEKGESTSS